MISSPSGNTWIIYTICNKIITQLRSVSIIKPYIDFALQNKDITELITGSGIAFSFKLLSLPLWFLTSLIISRWYGAEAMGLYGLTITVMSLLISMWMLWLGSAMARFLWESKAAKKNDEHTIYRTSMFHIIIAWWLLSGLLYISSSYIALEIFEEPKLIFPLKVGAFFLLPLMLKSLNTQYMLAYKKVFHSEVITKIAIPLSLLTIVSVSYWIWPTYYIPIRAHLIADTIWMTISFYFLYKYSYTRFFGSIYPSTTLLRISVPILMTTLMGTLLVHTDKIMLWNMINIPTVWVYEVVFILASLISIPQVILSPIITPLIAHKYYEWNMPQLQYILTTTTRIITALSWCILIGLILFHKKILLLYGNEFILWKEALLLLAGGLFFWAITWSTSTYLTVTWREHIPLTLSIITVLYNILWNYLLIPTYWITWTVLVTLTSLLLVNIYTTRYIYTHDHIKIYIH